VSKRPFGVSTHLFHHERLTRDHFQAIAAHGFEMVELFATRTHFDYHNPAAVADLQQWLADAGVTLRSIHAPTAESFIGGVWGGSMSIASVDPELRARAVREAEQALFVARRIPIAVLVTHVGIPRMQPRDADVGAQDVRAAARRSVEELQRAADPLGVRIAVEVIPNELSRAGSLVHFVEEDLEGLGVGICLDFGHAHIDGDVVDAVETVSEHVIATHLHDNGGRSDDHLMPMDGTIDWAGALTAVQKIGYDGPLVFEVGAQGPSKDSLARLKRTREKMERWLTST
jgi:sugar phosphate isomerase/epimerase